MSRLFVIATLCAMSCPAMAADYSLTNLAVGTPTQLTIPADGVIHVTLSRTGVAPTAPETLQFGLSPFQDSQGVPLPLTILLPGQPSPAPVTQLAGLLSYPVAQPVTQLRLLTSVPQSASPFTGHLTVSRNGALLATYNLVLSRPSADRRAKVLISPKTPNPMPLTGEVPFFWFGPAPPVRFDVVLRDDSGNWPLNGIYARLEGSKGPDGTLSHSRDIALSLGDPATDKDSLWELNPAAAAKNRTIPPNGQVLVHGLLLDPKPGTYTAKIRFLAANSQEAEGQVLDVEVKVKRSMVWAVVILFCGFLVSLLSTVIAKSRAETLNLQRAVLEAREVADPLKNEPPTLMISWVQAVFGMVDSIRRRLFITAADVIGDRLKQAAQHVPVLRRISEIRASLDHIPNDMKRRRAHKVLRQIAGAQKTGALSPEAASALNARLDELAKWTAADGDKLYRADLIPDIDGLTSKARPDAFPAGAMRNACNALLAELAKPLPEDLTGASEGEADYARLKLLWEWRDSPKGPELAAKIDEPISNLFVWSDDRAWEQLKAADAGLYFSDPRQTSLEPLEPFRPLRFAIATHDPARSDNFLFKHGLKYHWTLKFEYSKSKSITLDMVTDEPRLYQYAPAKCTIKVSAKIRYPNDSLAVDVINGPDQRTAFEVTIGGSPFVNWLKAHTSAELSSIVIAVVVGTFSGLLLQYLNNETFGSARDCIALFLWGAGADQASKSFADVMGRFAPASKPKEVPGQ